MTGKYLPERHPDTIAALTRRGLTDEQIAHDIGVSYKTLREWRKKYVAVSAALKEGKVIADSEVEKALYRRACGYTYTEKKVIKHPDGSVRSEITEKEVAPDPACISIWLMNRNPAIWRNVQRVEVTGKDQGPVQITNLSDKQLAALLAKKR